MWFLTNFDSRINSSDTIGGNYQNLTLGRLENHLLDMDVKGTIVNGDPL